MDPLWKQSLSSFQKVLYAVIFFQEKHSTEYLQAQEVKLNIIMHWIRKWICQGNIIAFLLYSTVMILHSPENVFTISSYFISNPITPCMCIEAFNWCSHRMAFMHERKRFLCLCVCIIFSYFNWVTEFVYRYLN